MKDDERKFLELCRTNKDLTPREIYTEIGMNQKRACYILDKWARKGWYNYGVSIDMGWMETDDET